MSRAPTLSDIISEKGQTSTHPDAVPEPSSESNSTQSGHVSDETQGSIHSVEHDKEAGPKTEVESPDGGYGWFVVFGAFLVQVTCFGTMTSVMQDYYETHGIGGGGSNVVLRLSFVGTIAAVFLNLSGPVSQVLGSYFGPRKTNLLGALLISIGLIMAGFSTQVWHLYLTQGICFGIGASLMYVSMMAIAPKWFSRRRSTALGIISSGSGVGGVIYPIIINAINTSLGGAWTYRIIGFISLACNLIACALIRELVPSKTRVRLRDIIELSVFKNKNYVIWTVGATIQLTGYFAPFFFLPAYAAWVGLSTSQGSALVAVASTANFIGRILCGLLADRIGPINSNIIYLILGGISSLLVWTFAYSYSALLGYAFFFGLFCASYYALLSPITFSLLGPKQFPSGLSLVLVCNSVAIFGVNIASAIEGHVDAEPFFTYKMFSGVVYILGAIIMFGLKFKINRKLFAKV